MKTKWSVILIYLIPSFILFGFVYAYPIAHLFLVSFFRVGLRGILQKYVGIENYSYLLSADFVQTIVRTVVFVSVSVPLAMGLGLVGALLLNHDFRGRNVLRALVCIPWFTPQSIVGIVWHWMVHPTYGLINNLLLQFNLTNETISFLSFDKAMWICIAMRCWRSTPFVILSLLAALQSIPESIYDASSVDGARPFQRLVYITLPMIKPVLVAVSLLLVIWSSVTFDMIWTLTQGGPVDSTKILSIAIYRKAFFEGNFGIASAMAVVTIIGLVVFTAIQLRVIRRGRK